MTRFPRIWHPFLLAIYPILALFADNISQTPPQELLRPLLLALLITPLLLLISYRVTSNWHKAALLGSLMLALFFAYGHVYRSVAEVQWGHIYQHAHRYLVFLWITLLLLGFWGIQTQLTHPQPITQFLNVTIGIATLLAGVNIALFIFQTNKGATATPEATTATAVAPAHQPDIYYIIVDGYGRHDILQELYNHDNNDFLTFLTDKGFYIADNSYSNYAQTGLSLASSLNYAYLDPLIKQVGETADTRTPLKTLINDSRIRTYLAGQGYEIVAFNSGYSLTELNDADTYLAPHHQQFNNFESLLLANSATVIWFNRHHRRPTPRACPLYTQYFVPISYQTWPQIYLRSHSYAPSPPSSFRPRDNHAPHPHLTLAMVPILMAHKQSTLLAIGNNSSI